MSKKLMIVLALNNIVLGGALVMTNNRLGILALAVSRHYVSVAKEFASVGIWSADIADRLNSMYLFLLGP